jgi:hypothetical protein
MDFSQFTPKPVADTSVFNRQTGRKAKEDNPFLTAKWLEMSWEQDKGFELSGLTGEMSPTTTIRQGPKKGEVVKRPSYTGQIANFERLARRAAAELEVGVSIRIIPEVYASGAKKGQPKGTFTLFYRAQERRSYTRKQTESVAEPVDDVTDNV